MPVPDASSRYESRTMHALSFSSGILLLLCLQVSVVHSLQPRFHSTEHEILKPLFDSRGESAGKEGRGT